MCYYINMYYFDLTLFSKATDKRELIFQYCKRKLWVTINAAFANTTRQPEAKTAEVYCK